MSVSVNLVGHNKYTTVFCIETFRNPLLCNICRCIHIHPFHRMKLQIRPGRKSQLQHCISGYWQGRTELGRHYHTYKICADSIWLRYALLRTEKRHAWCRLAWCKRSAVHILHGARDGKHNTFPRETDQSTNQLLRKDRPGRSQRLWYQNHKFLFHINPSHLT